MRYCFDYCPNPEIVVLHLDKKVFNESVSTDPLHRSLSALREDGAQPKADPEIIADLMKIDGIKSVTGSPYEICIEKAKVFLWQELKPSILDCLKKIDPNLEEVRRSSSWPNGRGEEKEMDFDEPTFSAELN